MNLHRRLVVAAAGIAVFAAAAAAIALGSPAQARGLAGVGAAPEPGSGVESDLRRDAHRDEHGELVESAPRSDRAHGHLRCLQRDRAPLHADLRPERRRRRRAPRSSGSVAPSGGRRRRVHGAGRPVSRLGRNQLSERYAASLAALSDDGGDGGQSRERGIAWGTDVAQAVLAWRAADGFGASYPPFTGGTAVGQWRPIAPATAMSAQGLAFTAPFVVESNTQFRPGPPRASRERHLYGGLRRRQGARPPNRIDAHRRADGSSRLSGRATPASTGIRRRTRSRAPTISRCPTAIGSSPS